MISALVSVDGEFAESEVWAFSVTTSAIVAALVEARLEGRYSPEEWIGSLNL